MPGIQRGFAVHPELDSFPKTSRNLGVDKLLPGPESRLGQGLSPCGKEEDSARNSMASTAWLALTAPDEMATKIL